MLTLPSLRLDAALAGAAPLPLPRGCIESHPELELWSLPLEVADQAGRREMTREFLVSLLSERLGVPAAEIRLGRRACPQCDGPNGRPALLDPTRPPDRPLEFSLARAGGVALVALADGPVGVDIEPVPARELAEDVISLLHPGERAGIRSLPTAERPAAFARIWARKEAYLKGVGTGIAHGLHRKRVDLADPPGWRLFDLPAPPGHLAALAITC